MDSRVVWFLGLAVVASACSSTPASDGGVDAALCAVACDELTDSCPANGEVPDFDGDGHLSVACGGSDCDDEEPGAFPGNVEVCESDGRDEDCDPVTLGPDLDGDNEYPEGCCNGTTCGSDCDDSRATVNSRGVDGCGGGDEDCDGTVDEEPDSIFFRDQDSDNYGTDDDTLAAHSWTPAGSASAHARWFSGMCPDVVVC